MSFLSILVAPKTRAIQSLRPLSNLLLLALTKIYIKKIRKNVKISIKQHTFIKGMKI